MNDLPKHYKASNNQLRNATDIQIEDVRIIPYNAQSFDTTTKKIQFRMPRVGVLDGHRSFLSADINVTNGGCDSFFSLFRKMKVYIGNTLIVDEDNFGEARTKEADAYLNSNEILSSSILRTGYRQGHADSTKKTKIMSLADPIYWKRSFFANKIPLFKLDQVIVEFELYDDLNVSTFGDASAITVDNVEFHLYLLDSDSYRSEFGGEVKGSYMTHQRHYRNLPASSTKIAEVIPAHYNDVRFVLIEQQEVASLDIGTTGGTASTYNWNFSSNHTLNAINNLDLQIDGTRYPKNRIESENTNDISEIVHNLSDCWAPNNMRLGDNIHNYADKSDESNMYLGVPLSLSAKAVSGKKLSDKSGSIVVSADVTVTNQTGLKVWVYYTKFFSISSSGEVRVIE